MPYSAWYATYYFCNIVFKHRSICIERKLAYEMRLIDFLHFWLCNLVSHGWLHKIN
jgi:hypothetical protein